MKRIDDIREYLRGNRKGEAASRLERESLSDPFLYEALEGLTSTPGDPIDGLIRLERQLNERARSSRKKKSMWLYVAASIALLLVCGVLWFTRQEKEFASPVVEISRLTPLDMGSEQEAMLTLQDESTATLTAGIDTLRILSEKDGIGRSVARKMMTKEIELKSESVADQILPNHVKTGDSSLMKKRGMGSVMDSIVSEGDVVRFNRYMEEALRYPKEDLDAGNSGTINLSFELNKRCVPSRIQIYDGFSKESNDEIIRLLSKGPKWESSVTGKKIHVSVRFIIGKNGRKHKAILTVQNPRE